MNTITITKKKEQSYFNTSASALYSFDDDEGKSDVLDVLIVVVVFIVLLLSIVLMNECVEQAAVFPKEEEGKRAILFRVCINPKYNLTNLEKN